MKKFSLFVILSVLLILAFTTAQAGASSTDLMDQGKPDKTPGAKATEKALERLADPGKPEIPGKPENPGIGKSNKPDSIQGKIQHFRGVVKELVEKTSLTLTLDNGGEQTFLVTPETEIKIPTLGSVTDGTLLEPGVKVSVWAFQAESTAPAVVEAEIQLTAVKIHVTPGKPVKVRRVGIVTEYVVAVSEVDGVEVKGHVTILASDGVEYTFVLAEEIKFLPASLVMTDPATELMDKRVTIISPRNVVGVDHIARGIVVHLDDDGEDVEDTD